MNADTKVEGCIALVLEPMLQMIEQFWNQEYFGWKMCPLFCHDVPGFCPLIKAEEQEWKAGYIRSSRT